MKRCLLIMSMLLVCTAIHAPWCSAQCGPGGCCPVGATDTIPWAASNPAISQSRTPEISESRNPKIPYQSVVRVRTRDRDGTESWGSGVAMNWNDRVIVLTASHVVRDARAVWASDADGRYHACEILNQDRSWDVAVLRPTGKGRFVTARIAYRETGMFQRGDRLESCGLGDPTGRLAVNSGLFLRYARSSMRTTATDWLVLSGRARQGDSGGPVFNARGEVVGILWGTDGQTVVATQCGRLHVVISQVLGPSRARLRSKSKTVILTRPETTVVRERKMTAIEYPTPTPTRPAVADTMGLLNRGGDRELGILPICKPREPAPCPPVIIHGDPEVSRKLDVLIQNTTPPAAPAETPKPADETNPIVLILVIGGAVVLGFVIYFATTGKS